MLTLTIHPHLLIPLLFLAFAGGSDCNESAWNAGDPGLILGSGRSPGERNGYPLQYSYLENSMDSTEEPGRLQSMRSQSQTWLSNWTELNFLKYRIRSLHFHLGKSPYDLHMLSHFSCVQLFETLWPVACQAPLSMGFPRQEYWSGLPCSPSGELPDPGIEPMSLMSPVLAGRFFTISTTWEVLWLTHSAPNLLA